VACPSGPSGSATGSAEPTAPRPGQLLTASRGDDSGVRRGVPEGSSTGSAGTTTTPRGASGSARTAHPYRLTSTVDAGRRGRVRRSGTSTTDATRPPVSSSTTATAVPSATPRRAPGSAMPSPAARRTTWASAAVALNAAASAVKTPTARAPRPITTIPAVASRWTSRPSGSVPTASPSRVATTAGSGSTGRCTTGSSGSSSAPTGSRTSTATATSPTAQAAPLVAPWTSATAPRRIAEARTRSRTTEARMP
jgi:hypothetical protein